MKTFLAALLLAVATSARAEAVIYSQTFIDTATGSGAVNITSYTGWLLYDTDTHEVIDTLVNRKANNFKDIDRVDDFQFVTTGVGKFTLWFLLPTFTTGGVTFKGSTTLMSLGTTNKFYVPRTMTIKGSSYERSSNLLHEFSGSISLSTTLTRAANVAGQNIYDVARANGTRLLNKGYSYN